MNLANYDYYVLPLLQGRLATAEANMALYTKKLAELETIGKKDGTQYGEYCKQQQKHWARVITELHSFFHQLNS